MFDAKGGERSVTFSTTVADWTLNVANTTWCTASATNGTKGTATVKFTVAENTDYDNRSVSVTVKAGSASKTFTVSQKCTEALLVTTDKFELGREGGTIELEVKANISYQVEVAETAKS
ncbi:MAG: BACON domain-containing protein [Bacteroides sp.]|nr:BACON domain-containing protein [Bacteroides sp.]